MPAVLLRYSFCTKETQSKEIGCDECNVFIRHEGSVQKEEEHEREAARHARNGLFNDGTSVINKILNRHIYTYGNQRFHFARQQQRESVKDPDSPFYVIFIEYKLGSM